ncbi:MAG: N-acetylneuraminate synthase family protein [Acidobacteriota bacterium]
MKPTIHVIAEAGTNHNAKLETAKTLVDTAVSAGADSVKFQIIYPEGLYLPRFWQSGRYVPNEVFQKRLSGMLSDDDYRRLSDHCRHQGIAFSASVFDERGLRLLEELDVPYIKLASCDLNNSRLLKMAAETGRPLVVSTGMASLGEIEHAVSAILSTGNNLLTLMHCVSVYPCPTDRMNLAFLDLLKSAFGCQVGLSDHTESSLAAAVAVAKGVSWIEKHFTLDRMSDGFDHAYAMEPESFAGFIRDVRACEIGCRHQIEKLGESERITRQRARRGLYAARDVNAGEVVEATDVLVVRPEAELAPNQIDLIVGRRLRLAVCQYQAFSLAALEL